MNETAEYSIKTKRFAAFFIDFILIFIVWYLMTKSNLAQVNDFLTIFELDVAGSADVFAENIIKMVVALVLKLIFIQTLYFCLVPALIGNGKTLGKFFMRLSMVDEKTLEEIPATKLIFREFVGRGLIETLLILPMVVSICFVLFSDDGKMLHDKITRTIVIVD